MFLMNEALPAYELLAIKAFKPAAEAFVVIFRIKVRGQILFVLFYKAHKLGKSEIYKII